MDNKIEVKNIDDYDYYYGEDLGNIDILPIDYTHIQLMSITIPKTWYVLHDDCVLYYDDVAYDILQGNYSYTSLITVLNALASTFTLSFPSNIGRQTNKYTITDAGDHKIRTDDFYLAKCLGIERSIDLLFTDSSEFINVINFQSLDVLYLRCNAITKNNKNILQEVFSSGISYSTTFTFYNGQDNAKSMNSNLNQLRFRLTDLNDKDIDLEGGGSFHYCVRLLKSS